jgi:hypothetical protein
MNSKVTNHEEEFSCHSDKISTKTIEFNLNKIENFYEFERKLNKSIEEEEILTEITGILQTDYTDICTINNCNNNTNHEKFKGSCLPRPKNPIYTYFESSNGDKTS